MTTQDANRKHVVEILAMKMSLLRFDDEQSDRMIELTMREAGALAEHLYETVESLIEARMTVAAAPRPVVDREAIAHAIDTEAFADGARSAAARLTEALNLAAADEIAVRNKIAEWYGAEWNSKDSTFYETDDTGTQDTEDEGAMHAYRGFKWAQEMAQPVVDQEAALQELLSYCGVQSVDSDATEAEQLAYDDVVLRLTAILGVTAPQPVVDL